MCLAKKGKNQSHCFSRGKGSKRGHKKKNFRGKGVGIIKVRDPIFPMFFVTRMDMIQKHAGSHGRRSKKIEK